MLVSIKQVSTRISIIRMSKLNENKFFDQYTCIDLIKIRSRLENQIHKNPMMTKLVRI